MKPHPDGVMFVIVPLASPLFDKVTQTEFVVPTTTLPNAIFAGEIPIDAEPWLEVEPPDSGFVELVKPTQPAEANKAKRAATVASARRDVACVGRAEFDAEPA